jgi:hypothetical protein
MLQVCVLVFTPNAAKIRGGKFGGRLTTKKPNYRCKSGWSGFSVNPLPGTSKSLKYKDKLTFYDNKKRRYFCNIVVKNFLKICVLACPLPGTIKIGCKCSQRH